MKERTTPTTVWVTKYALTAGIRECEVVRISEDRHNIVVKWPGAAMDEARFTGSEWHDTKQEAISDAVEKRSRKVMSLQKQIDKLRAITF